MRRTAWSVGLGCWMVGVMAAGVLAARQPLDVCRVEAEAEAIRCLADELRPELRDHFHCSCIFRDLNRARNDVESAARRVRALARSRNRICDLPQEVACLVEKVNELNCLVERARGFRRDFGSRGLDRGCASRVERILAEMCHRATMLDALVSGPYLGGIHPSGGSFAGGYYGNGWDSGWNSGGTSPWGFGGGYSGPTNYNGTYFRTETSGFGVSPLSDPLRSLDRGDDFGREIQRSRSVTRSREYQKLSRNR